MMLIRVITYQLSFSKEIKQKDLQSYKVMLL